MTVRKGDEWGTQAALPPNLATFTTDRAASSWLATRMSANENLVKTDGSVAKARVQASDVRPEFGLLGGAVWRMLGGPNANLNGQIRNEAQKYSFDVIEIQLDDQLPTLCIASTLLHSRSWRQGALITKVADWRGQRVASKVHPNDGFLEAFEWKLKFSELLAVKSRWKQGPVLPHPKVLTSRDKVFHYESVKALRVFVDGVNVGRATTINARVLPDFCTVYA